MVQPPIVTMFQVFLGLVTIAFVMGTAAVLKAAWQRCVKPGVAGRGQPDSEHEQELVLEPQRQATSGELAV
jgi:hypothetical protein